MKAQTVELALRTQELIAITSFLHAGIITPEIVLAGNDIAVSIDGLVREITSEENSISKEGLNQLQLDIERMSQRVMPVAHA